MLYIRRDEFPAALLEIETARNLMVTELAALVGESYERAYTDMVRLQQLAELEEVVAVKQALGMRAGGGRLATDIASLLPALLRQWRWCDGQVVEQVLGMGAAGWAAAYGMRCSI